MCQQLDNALVLVSPGAREGSLCTMSSAVAHSTLSARLHILQGMLRSLDPLLRKATMGRTSVPPMHQTAPRTAADAAAVVGVAAGAGDFGAVERAALARRTGRLARDVGRVTLLLTEEALHAGRAFGDTDYTGYAKQQLAPALAELAEWARAARAGLAPPSARWSAAVARGRRNQRRMLGHSGGAGAGVAQSARGEPSGDWTDRSSYFKAPVQGRGGRLGKQATLDLTNELVRDHPTSWLDVPMPLGSYTRVQWRYPPVPTLDSNGWPAVGVGVSAVELQPTPGVTARSDYAGDAGYSARLVPALDDAEDGDPSINVESDIDSQLHLESGENDEDELSVGLLDWGEE
jgi:hypothetical protein